MKNRLQNQESAHAAAGLWPLVEKERQTACHGSIEWVRMPITPLPEVYEDNSEEAWASWDAAVRAGVFHGVKK